MSHYCIEIGCDWMGGKSLFSGALALVGVCITIGKGHEQKCRIQDDNRTTSRGTMNAMKQRGIGRSYCSFMYQFELQKR